MSWVGGEYSIWVGAVRGGGRMGLVRDELRAVAGFIASCVVGVVE